MKITKELIISKGATCDQVDLFVETFPRGTTITKTSVELAVKAGLDLEWAIIHFLPATARIEHEKVCATAQELYAKTCITAQELYEKTRTQARKLYEKTHPTPARKLYAKACTTARELHEKTRITSRKLYAKTCITATIKILLKYRNGKRR